MSKEKMDAVNKGFAPLLEKYFLSYMITQRNSSARTISTYRDSFTLYLRYMSSTYGIAPDKIEMDHFALDYLVKFCAFLQEDRGCKPSTVNLRMSAIKSFLKFAAIEAPEHSGTIRKSLSLPVKKTDKQVMSFVTKDEYESMLEVCDTSDPIALRDKMILMILYNTGCRVSELINVCVKDVSVETLNTSSIRFFGKGRKERVTPIWKSTATYICKYIETNGLSYDDRLLLNRRKECLTRSGVGQRIASITKKAATRLPSLKEKRVTPHTFRHSTAMNLLQAGIDISTIAIWLGHESIETTHKYMLADIEIKRKAMEKLNECLL